MTDLITYQAIVAADVLDAANRIAEGLGRGSGVFSIPVQATENGPVTHFGFSSEHDATFGQTWAAIGGGLVPPGVSADDLTAVLPVFQMWTVPPDVEPVDEFQRRLAGMGLRPAMDVSEQ